MLRFATCLLAIAPVAAWSADSPDSSFFKQVAEAGISEVDAGTLAQSKGSSQAVKDFGAMMVKDHSAANDKLKSLAAGENVTLPTSASTLQMASKAKLEMLSGESFDKAYIKNQVSAHEQTIAVLRKEIASGKDPQAQAFAKEVLPTVQSHLKHIRQIAAQAGVKAK